jgi:TrmH family RNA methyltransferase
LPLLEDARRRGASLIGVTASVFSKIGYGQRADGMVAVAERPSRDLGQLSVGDAAVVAVVDRVEKPGNLGAILRTADAAGVAAILAVDAAVDVYGPNVIRASLGTVFCVPLVETDADSARSWLRAGRFRVVAAYSGGDTQYTAVDYRSRTAIVLGSESRGLGADWGGGDVIRAAVPMRGRADSLNVSTTAALFFYEALRQRGTGA